MTQLIHSNTRSKVPRNRGFTFVELCIGMIVTALIASALAGFTLAVSNCWKQASNTQSGAMLGNQLMQRLYSRLSTARRIGSWNSGDNGEPAGLIYWAADLNGDGAMQFSELAVILYNSSNKTLDYYKPVIGGGVSDADWSDANFTDSSAIGKFIDGVSPTPLLRHVSSVWLKVDDANSSSTNAPVAWWQVGIQLEDGTTSTEGGAVALRSPG